MGLQRFDDGRHQPPGGIAAPVERVVVVGAGIAGLTVANALAHAGIECIVLEARERAGGRLHTIDLGGSPVDMGGSWIHHPVGNPLRALAADAGVSCLEGDPLPRLGAYDLREARRLSRAEVEDVLALRDGAFSAALERLRRELGPTASAAQAIETFVDGSGLSGGPARRARQGLRAEIEADAADAAERQTLRWLWNEIEYGGDLFGDLPVGGYRSLVRAVSTGLDVRLGVEVTEVAVDDRGVRVR
ncbi:MAG TPA: FAD-dependent oxidoreductase, partial [Thermoleophilia bacterium]|nr:FAD-dependent oxidoreductase [Thermoleophilia bacterium]